MGLLGGIEVFVKVRGGFGRVYFFGKAEVAICVEFKLAPCIQIAGCQIVFSVMRDLYYFEIL